MNKFTPIQSMILALDFERSHSSDNVRRQELDLLIIDLIKARDKKINYPVPGGAKRATEKLKNLANKTFKFNKGVL